MKYRETCPHCKEGRPRITFWHPKDNRPYHWSCPRCKAVMTEHEMRVVGA